MEYMPLDEGCFPHLKTEKNENRWCSHEVTAFLLGGKWSFSSKEFEWAEWYIFEAKISVFSHVLAISPLNMGVFCWDFIHTKHKIRSQNPEEKKVKKQDGGCFPRWRIWSPIHSFGILWIRTSLNRLNDLPKSSDRHGCYCLSVCHLHFRHFVHGGHLGGHFE